MHIDTKVPINGLVNVSRHFGSGFALVIMVYSTATFFGANLPKPAWSSDIEQIRGDVDDLSYTILQGRYLDVQDKLVYAKNQLKVVTDPDYLTILRSQNNRLELQLLNIKAALSKHDQHEHEMSLGQ